MSRQYIEIIIYNITLIKKSCILGVLKKKTQQFYLQKY
jgi:hypothetical protein